MASPDRLFNRLWALLPSFTVILYQTLLMSYTIISILYSVFKDRLSILFIYNVHSQKLRHEYLNWLEFGWISAGLQIIPDKRLS